MLYLYIEKNQIKLIASKKSLFGQYSISSFEKKFQVDLLKNGAVADVDVLASATKEIIQTSSSLKDKQVFLILPQTSFHFLRFAVPNDIASAAIDSFIKDKIKASFPQDTQELWYDYFFIENGGQKFLSLFTIDAQIASKYQDTLRLLDLQIEAFLPETLAYFKLFEKTLRIGKVENIMYGKYEKEYLVTYLYDSFGLLEEEKNEYKLSANKTAQSILKLKSVELEKKNRKVNRLILSGFASDTVRQDTFTKEVGMWTNPLKRIIPQFYQEYLKMLVTADNKPLSILEYDMCLGAFIFSVENKGFSLLKRKYSSNTLPSSSWQSKTKFKLPAVPSFTISKELVLFVASFILSFGIFSLIGKNNFKITLPQFTKNQQIKIMPTTPPPTPTPTPSFTREELKIKILNGSGTKGKASVVKDILKDKKYLEIVTGNADNFDYIITEIQVKKTKPDAQNYITEDLKDYVQKPKITTLDEKEAADAVIIVGQDFK